MNTDEASGQIFGPVYEGLALIAYTCTSGLSILFYDVIRVSLSGATLCDNYCFTLIVFLQCTCSLVCLYSNISSSGYHRLGL